MSNITTQNIPITQKDSKGLVCVSLEVHMWSGRKRLRKEDLIARNPEFANLPPESLATLGAIKVCDPKDLKPFSVLKREAEKLLAVRGLPFVGARGIPDEEPVVTSVYRELSRMKAEFEQHALQFKKRFEDAVEKWKLVPENADWANLIDDIPSAEQVAGKLSFGFQMYRVSAPSDVTASPVNALYAQQLTGLKGELFTDAANEAEVLITKYLTGEDPSSGVVRRKDKITWKTLRPLKRISDKFVSFSFLDPTVEPLAEMIDHVLDLLPSDGPIDGVHLMHVWTLAQTLANPQRAIEVAQLAYQSGNSAATFGQIVQPSRSVAAPQEFIQPSAEVIPEAQVVQMDEIAIAILQKPQSDQSHLQTDEFVGGLPDRTDQPEVEPQFSIPVF